LEALGRHIIVEYYGCNKETLNSAEKVEALMVDAAERMGATIISVKFHQFSPQGVSGVIVISESHLTIHTWPEYGYAAVDVFTCGNVINPWDAHHILKESFEAQRESAMELRRGLFNVPPGTLPSAYGVTEPPNPNKK